MENLGDANMFLLAQEIRIRYILLGWNEQQIYTYYGCLPATVKLILTNQIYPSLEYTKWLEEVAKDDTANDIFGDEPIK